MEHLNLKELKNIPMCLSVRLLGRTVHGCNFLCNLLDVIFDTFFHLEQNNKSKMMHNDKTVNVFKSLDTGIRERNDVHFQSRELRRNWYNSRILRITCMNIEWLFLGDRLFRCANCKLELSETALAVLRQSTRTGHEVEYHVLPRGVEMRARCARNDDKIALYEKRRK